MTALPGTWDLSLSTPIGTIAARYTFVESDDGWEGTATGAAETVPLSDVTVEPTAAGDRVTWTQRITKPLRLDLAFDVLVAGDELSGHSRAGRLPASRVTGRRAVA